MDNKKLVLYGLLCFCALATVLGLVQLFKSGGANPATGEKTSLEIPKLGKNGIAVVYIYGDIYVERQTSVFPGFMAGADQIVDRLRKLGKNPNVKGVVLRINSPGGSTGASQEIYEEVKKLRQNGKKIVVSMGDVGASGAYYISCPADKIIANPSTITGSIGVIFNFSNMEELFKKIGVKFEVVKSGKNKDIGAFWRAPREEERKLLQGLIDGTYEQFVKAVAEGRKLPVEKVRELADGSIYTGEQALKLGLIDQLGDFPDAIQEAGRLTGLGDDPYFIKDYSSVEKFWEMFGRKFDDSSLSKIVEKTQVRLAYSLE